LTNIDNNILLEKVKLIHISDLHFFSTKNKVLPDYFFEQLDDPETLSMADACRLATLRPQRALR